MAQLPIEDILKKYGLDDTQIGRIKEKADKDDSTLMAAVEASNVLDESMVLQAFSEHFGVKSTELEKKEIPENLIRLIPREIAVRNRLIPIEKAGNHLIVAMTNPANQQSLYSIRFKTGYNIRAVLTTEKRFEEAFKKYYPDTSSKMKPHGAKFSDLNKTHTNAGQKNKRIEIKSNSSEGPIIQLVNEVLSECLRRGGSDIHIEPYETSFRVRIRVDGTLLEVIKPPPEIKDALTSRVKIMAGLDIAEKRLPQDGGIRVEIQGKPIDFRVNTLPTIYGEKVVMRILDKSALQVDMASLGFENADLERFLEAIHRPFGMVLVTGPTGSGKTTTLYSALSELNKTTENIMTAEDPVEYNLDGINQVQMKPDIGLDFAAALRAFLRQDPDIVMVGEIRDLETAEIGIKAALTGHLVLSTLHTNSAVETIIRIKNMGVETFNISSALSCIVAQRLAKRICSSCRVEDDMLSPDALVDLGIHPNFAAKVKGYKGVGCEKCGFTGNRGRVALHEVMLLDEPIKEAILNNANAIDMKRLAIKGGMKTLRQAALSKLINGIVDATEVVKNTNPDHKVERKKEVA